LPRGRLRSILLLITLTVLLTYLFNPQVYAYRPSLLFGVEVVAGRPIAPEAECVGFIPSTTTPREVRLVMGDPVCVDRGGRLVYDSVRLTINTTTGYWIFRDIAILLINVSRLKAINIVVEKPLKGVEVLVILYSGERFERVVVNTTTTSTYRIIVEPSSWTYRVSIVVNANRPIRERFRVGFYIEELD